MNDFELDGLVARVAVLSDVDVGMLALSGPEADLCRAIVSTAREELFELTEEPTSDGRRVRHGRQRRMRRRVGALVGAAVAALIIMGLLVFQGPSSENRSAWDVRAVALAETGPRLLVTGDRWKITDVVEFGEDFGELRFSDGQAVAELFWRPGTTHAGYVDDRAHDGADDGSVRVAGHDARVFAETSEAGVRTGTFFVLWRQGDNSVELRTANIQQKLLKGFLERVRQVDVDTWLSAMPASVVRPNQRAAAVDEMLADIPIPHRFDAAELRSAAKPGLSRYQLGAQVTGAVACSWIDQWLAGTESGDHAAVAEGEIAMSSSRQWAILQEMTAEGLWPQTIWELADALQNGGVLANTPLSLRDAAASLCEDVRFQLSLK